MKTLKNQAIKLPVNLNGEVNEKGTYADLVRILISHVQGQNYDLNDIKCRLRIGKVLDNLNGNQDIQFEDEDAKYLQAIIKNYRWSVVHQDILDFVEAINNMK